jgi:hypothetical protein
MSVSACAAVSDFPFCRETTPEEPFLTKQADQGAGAADLAPDHGEDEGDHDGQGEHALAQAEAVAVSHLTERVWVDDLGKMLRHLWVHRHTVGSLGSIAPDRPRVADGRSFLVL